MVDDKKAGRGRVERMQFISRMALRDNPDSLFVFGDNMEGKGFGGQAGQMRGEPNAVGVPTKWRPGRKARDYFTDADLKDRDVWHAIHSAFEQIRAALEAGQTVVIPADGLGTGLAELPTRAPKIHAMIEAAIDGLRNELRLKKQESAAAGLEHAPGDHDGGHDQHAERAQGIAPE